MEKEVDKKLRKPDPKRTGNSVTGKPLDKINTNPQLEVKEQQEEAEVLSIIEQLEELMHLDLEEEGLLLDEALDIQQRLKRARIMRRYERKIQRAKEISKKRIADQPHLRKRAFAKARQAVRTRLAGQVGADYQQLGPSEKIRIDKMLDTKTAMIKRIAQRLLPRVRTAEMKRLQSYIQGKKLDNAGQKEGRTVSESLKELGLNNSKDIQQAIRNVLENTYDPRLVSVKKNFSMNKLVEALDSMIDDKIEITAQCMHALEEKAAKTGIKLSTLTEVFARGYRSNRNPKLLPEQMGFARVNSFINKGKTYYTEDKDLVKPVYEMRKIGGKWQKVIIEEVKAPVPVKSKIDDLFEARAPGNPYVKPHVEKGSTKQTAWKASDKWGKIKYFGTDFKKAAEKHAFKEENELEEKRGLWDNIHAKRRRIEAGSGERMRKPGTKGAPTAQNFRDASKSVKEAYDVNDKHYKALTDLDLNTKNRDMTTQHDGYGPLNPLDESGSEPFWAKKAKMWNTTVEAAKAARCGNCAAFNQSPAIMKKMAEGLGPAASKIQDLANLGFCELFEFKCAGNRTCDKWLANGPIKEDESKATKVRKKLEVIDRKPPHTEFTKQAEIQKKIIDESFNIAFASGIGVTVTAKDLGMVAKSGFELHPSVVEETEEIVGEEVKTADKEPVVVPSHKDANGNTIPAKTVMRKKNSAIIKSGNVHDGEGD